MFNKIILIGNLTRDVELKYTGSGAAIATFGLAVNKQWKDRNSGEKREEVCYIDVSIFGAAAEVANSHLGKGRRILVEGELVFEQWQDQSGQKRSRHKVRCDAFKFLDAHGSNNIQSDGRDHCGNAYDDGKPNPNYDPNPKTGQQSSGNASSDFPPDDEIPFSGITKRMAMLI